MKKWIPIAYAVFLLFGLCGCSNNIQNSTTNPGNGSTSNDVHAEYCEVTFKNYDSSILFYTSVKYGETAVYQGSVPSRPADTVGYHYSFCGWDKSLENVKVDTTFIAQYTSSINEYTITWNIDGNKTYETYQFGEVPSYKGTPSKKSDGRYCYEFDKWTPSIIEATDDIEYTAVFNRTLLEGQVDYDNAEMLEKELNNGTNVLGCIVTFNVLSVHPNSAYGFNLWAGEHLNFISEDDSSVKGVIAGDEITAKITSVDTFGSESFLLEYDVVHFEPSATFTIVWKNYDGSILETDTDVKYGEIPSFDGATPVRESDDYYSYIFSGWNEEIMHATEDKTYIASYSSSKITYEISLSFDSNKGVATGSGEYAYGDSVTLKATPSNGYYFTAWWYNNISGIMFDNENPCIFSMEKENLSLIAGFSPIVYSITYNGIYETLENAVYEYTIETDTFTLPTPTRIGYEFCGWKDNLNNPVSSVTKGTTGNLYFVAEWQISTCQIDVLPNNSSRGVVSGGGSYDYGNEVTLTAISNEGYYFDGWSVDGVFLSSNSNYSFVACESLTIVGNFETDPFGVLEKGNTFTFGTYPQALVDDEEQISSLSGMFTSLPTSENPGVWTSYNYYDNYRQTDNMWYYDVDCDSDGSYDFRGVYFSGYRANFTQNSASSNNYQSNNGFTIGNVYWFKYEPISWKIISTSNGYYCMTTKIIDSQSMINGTGATGVKYEDTVMRAFLNGEFYDSAFNANEKNRMLQFEVRNSVSTTASNSNSISAGKSTFDIVTLLSYSEIKNNEYLNEQDERTLGFTDYAKCMGLNCSGQTAPWWTRSPNPSVGSYKWSCVTNGGNFGSQSYNYTACGMVPVITLKK